MKRLIAAAVLLATPAFAADPAEGMWRTQADDNGNYGVVRIYDCDGMVCGQLVKGFDGAGQEVVSENIGKRILWDMTSAGGGAYKGGKIFSPDRGKTYNSKMTLAGDVLKVSGCVFGLCREQTWTRAN